ncbi:helix-turn-helix domain-containing protein [Methylomonas rivi]|uniref:Helix-turn-helix domain-containing protein n=1 Tax=Methylomonas rivi TaxID=2952226 RepID=A0ABT1U9H3_9GAMM|nr:helix-turn-helix transcriptional regulator [Methylomonas sp. WSC-6]MCQ8130508.1 helix-turn-helix domain-containing protein [Methylomonas sp. WSC-6]
MKEKIRKIREKSGMNRTEFAERTGIQAKTWSNIENGLQKANEDHLLAITKEWPEYALWLMTNQTAPECGQISPELEEIRVNLKQGTQ